MKYIILSIYLTYKRNIIYIIKHKVLEFIFQKKMKFKKAKLIKKIINFFRINYDFHFPYTLLIDGNFLN